LPRTSSIGAVSQTPESADRCPGGHQHRRRSSQRPGELRLIEAHRACAGCADRGGSRPSRQGARPGRRTRPGRFVAAVLLTGAATNRCRWVTAHGQKRTKLRWDRAVLRVLRPRRRGCGESPLGRPQGSGVRVVGVVCGGCRGGAGLAVRLPARSRGTSKVDGRRPDPIPPEHVLRRLIYPCDLHKRLGRSSSGQSRRLKARKPEGCSKMPFDLVKRVWLGASIRESPAVGPPF
jgi:hypothetical protein